MALVSPSLQGTLTTALVAVLLFLVFDPLRKRAQLALDRKFRQGAYDPAQLVADVVGDLRDAGEDLAGDVLHRLAAAHRPDRQAFWVFALEAPGAAGASRARPAPSPTSRSSTGRRSSRSRTRSSRGTRSTR